MYPPAPVTKTELTRFPVLDITLSFPVILPLTGSRSGHAVVSSPMALVPRTCRPARPCPAESPGAAHSRGSMQSHRWDRPARNAGLSVIRQPGLRSGVREMAGRDARRYQIVGTGVPAGFGTTGTEASPTGFLVGQASCLSLNDGQDARPTEEGIASLTG